MLRSMLEWQRLFRFSTLLTGWRPCRVAKAILANEMDTFILPVAIGAGCVSLYFRRSVQHSKAKLTKTRN